MRRNLLICFLCFALIKTCQPAFSATPAGAGVQGRSTLEQLKQQEIEKKLIEPAQKQDKKDDAIKMDVQKDVVLDDGKIFNPKFKLNKVTFEGNTVIKTKHLNKLAKDIEGTEIYFADLLDFTRTVSTYYQGKGYLTSYASIPEQEIVDGNVVIRINESRIDKLGISGEKWAREAYLRNIVMGRKGLREGDVFSAKALQAAMKEMTDVDYLIGTTGVNKKGDKNITTINLEVQDRFPITTDINWDNYGRDITGRQRAAMILGSQNLTGFGDRIYGGAILTSGSKGILAGYSIPITPYGTTLNYDYSYSNVTLGGALKALKIKGNSRSHFVSVKHPLLRNAKTDIISSVGIDFVNTDSTMELLNLSLSDYKLTVVRSAIYAVTNDDYGRWIGNIGADFGMHGLGASGNIKDGPESNFYKFTAGAIRVQRLPLDSVGILRVNGQYSPNRLYAIEQMQIGGPFTLRGYQPAELIGDYGVTGTAEVRFPIPFFKALLPQKIEFIDERIKLATFYDFGYVKEHGNLYGYPQNFLHSVGFGTYINLTKYLTAQFGWGIPIGYKHYGEKSCRFYFGINTELDKAIPLKPRQKGLDI